MRADKGSLFPACKAPNQAPFLVLDRDSETDRGLGKLPNKEKKGVGFRFVLIQAVGVRRLEVNQPKQGYLCGQCGGSFAFLWLLLK